MSFYALNDLENFKLCLVCDISPVTEEKRVDCVTSPQRHGHGGQEQRRFMSIMCIGCLIPSTYTPRLNWYSIYNLFCCLCTTVKVSKDNSRSRVWHATLVREWPCFMAPVKVVFWYDRSCHHSLVTVISANIFHQKKILRAPPPRLWWNCLLWCISADMNASWRLPVTTLFSELSDTHFSFIHINLSFCPQQRFSNVKESVKRGPETKLK